MQIANSFRLIALGSVIPFVLLASPSSAEDEKLKGAAKGAAVGAAVGAVTGAGAGAGAAAGALIGAAGADSKESNKDTQAKSKKEKK